MINRNSNTIKKRYNRIAGLYDFIEYPFELFWSHHRADLFKNLTGKVLEIGVGTGKNIPYYPQRAKITAIDFSNKMIETAKKKFSGSHPEVNFMEMDVQDLSFAEASFDCVVCTCVFCSVPDPVKGLMEIRRVLKPTGKFLMLEHMISRNRTLRHLMNIFNFIPLNMLGANINRDTMANLKLAGFTRIKTENICLDIVKKISINPVAFHY